MYSVAWKSPSERGFPATAARSNHMQHQSPQPLTRKYRHPHAGWVGVLLVLLLQGLLWARPTRTKSRPASSIWSRISFSEKEPDFVPPPPRDEFDDESRESSADEDEELAQVPAEPLFDATGEDHITDERVGDQWDPLEGDPLPLAPQRDYFDPGFNHDVYAANTWQIMPAGLMYRSYLAGEKESRMGTFWAKDQTGRTVWENTLGGRLGLLRYGTPGAYRPQGWQLDFEGAALSRVLPGTESTILEATDYRAGFQSTWAFDRWHVKAGYYHLSSHLGDEFVIANPLVQRFNYVRDSTVLGVTYDISDDWQTYGEIAYALGYEDGAKPLEFQYGLQYSPLVFGLRGAPFAAVNGHTREDFDYITSVNAQAGWQWRGTESQHLMRIGLQYYSGPALQDSFPGKYDHLVGGGMWFDF